MFRNISRIDIMLDFDYEVVFSNFFGKTLDHSYDGIFYCNTGEGA